MPEASQNQPPHPPEDRTPQQQFEQFALKKYGYLLPENGRIEPEHFLAVEQDIEPHPTVERQFYNFVPGSEGKMDSL